MILNEADIFYQVVNRNDLQKQGIGGIEIDPWNTDRLRYASYVLSLAFDYALISPSTSRLFYSLEEMRLPQNLLALVVPMSPIVGMFVQCTTPILTQGPSRPQFEVFNTTKHPLHLTQGLDIGEVMFLPVAPERH